MCLISPTIPILPNELRLLRNISKYDIEFIRLLLGYLGSGKRGPRAHPAWGACAGAASVTLRSVTPKIRALPGGRQSHHRSGSKVTAQKVPNPLRRYADWFLPHK